MGVKAKSDRRAPRRSLRRFLIRFFLTAFRRKAASHVLCIGAAYGMTVDADAGVRATRYSHCRRSARSTVTRTEELNLFARDPRTASRSSPIEKGFGRWR